MRQKVTLSTSYFLHASQDMVNVTLFKCSSRGVLVDKISFCIHLPHFFNLCFGKCTIGLLFFFDILRF